MAAGCRMRRGSARSVLMAAALLLAGVGSPCAFAQTVPEDTLVNRATILSSVPEAEDASPHSPRGAVLRAAIVPGWGQVYNRQYYKLPFVYGGLGGIAYGAWHNHQRYRVYQEAYLFAEPRLWTDGEPSYPDFEDAYRRMLEIQGLPPDETLSPEDAAARRQRLAPNLRSIRDNFRRNRDLLTIGVGLFYALTVLDAYVSAHLMDFDVGDDLSFGVAPTPAGMHARMTWTF